MDLESEDEDKENEESGENGVEEEVEDEKNTSHCMEELWEGGKTQSICFKTQINRFCFIEGIQLPPEPRGECSRELQVCRYWYFVVEPLIMT